MLARRIPQELCDTIIDTLHEDHDSLGDLKSCSLVCRSFVTRAQSHIFSTISVGRAPHEGHFDRILQASWLARLARFNALIGSSPRLLGYVRTLDIESCETGEIIILLAQIPWSRVHTVWIRDIPDRTPGLVLDSVHVLVAIPSLRKLTLESLLWKSWTADVLHAILAHCTVELQSLELWFHTLEPGSSLFPPLASPSTSSRSKIRELTLWRSPSIAELLNDPACSFDLSALRQIRCVGINAGLNALLRRSGATVRTLHINAAGHSRTLISPRCLRWRISPPTSQSKETHYTSYSGAGPRPSVS
ncbi:hypothetical protein K438DRAFT_199655 [Mycena galopus ATCC 62051]|nr:hypothetical protein K438DRAFT_199655 [Mycena galopus ATCC 62051]